MRQCARRADHAGRVGPGPTTQRGVKHDARCVAELESSKIASEVFFKAGSIAREPGACRAGRADRAQDEHDAGCGIRN